MFHTVFFWMLFSEIFKRMVLDYVNNFTNKSLYKFLIAGFETITMKAIVPDIITERDTKT